MKTQVKKIAQFLGFDIISRYQLERNDVKYHLSLLLGNESRKTIFDVGAAKGEFCVLFNKLFDKSKIYAFEPQEDYFNYIEKTLSDICQPYKIALSDKKGESSFYVTKSNPSSSLIKPLETNTSIDNYTRLIKEIEVQTETIDGFCEKNRIEKIDLLKMDTQGSELFVLKGAKNLLKNNLIDVIYSEVEFFRLYNEQPLFYDVAKYLETFNYKLYNIYNSVYVKNSILSWSDVIFVKDELFQKCIS